MEKLLLKQKMFMLSDYHKMMMNIFYQLICVELYNDFTKNDKTHVMEQFSYLSQVLNFNKSFRLNELFFNRSYTKIYIFNDKSKKSTLSVFSTLKCKAKPGVFTLRLKVCTQHVSNQNFDWYLKHIKSICKVFMWYNIRLQQHLWSKVKTPNEKPSFNFDCSNNHLNFSKNIISRKMVRTLTSIHSRIHWIPGI